MLMRELVIGKNDAGQRLDKFLSKAVRGLPFSMMYKAIRTKKIKVNRARAKENQILAEGDTVQLFLRDEFFDAPTGDTRTLADITPKLSVIYEDENILLMDKKNGLVVHEDNEGTVDTLVNRMQHYLYAKGEYDPADENSFTPSLCNRLDRNTGGIVIAAKNAESLRILNQKIKDRELEKKYLCIVVGVPPKKSDTMTAYLFKDSKTNIVTVSDKKTDRNKTIVTKYSVLKTDGKLSLVEVELLTGRTHQIRAHMAYIGCPLLGDGKYGSNKVNRSYGIKTQALYSYKLKFAFTKDGGILEYLNGREFTVPEVWFEGMFLEK